MLEVWANLYGVTGEKEHYELIQRYDRRRLFDPLLAGQDVLTNMHMNTTIPEVHGAARAWEVTGEERWRRSSKPYWRMGVTERGYYATGGQTNGEIWTPPGELAARLGNKHPGALHGLQHDAPGRLSAALDRRPGIRRLLGAQPVERHPGPAAPRDRHDRLLPAAPTPAR